MYEPIPVDSARQLGDERGKDIVLIVAWDSESNKTNIVTWGRAPEQKSAAAAAGERIAKQLGLADAASDTHQDYRREGEAAAAVDRLVQACRAADHALGSVLACRDGISDSLLQDVRNALQAAMAAS